MALGCAGTTSDTWSLDLNAKYDFKVRGAELFVRVDAFNVFNNDAEAWNWHFAERSWNGVPYENFGETEYHQAPRSVRFGFGMSF